MKPAPLRALGAGAVVLAFVAAASPAAARPVDLVDHTPTLSNRADFEFRQGSYDGAGDAVGVADASLGNRGDAFDGGLRFQVNYENVTAAGGRANLRGSDLTTREVALASTAGVTVQVGYHSIPGTSTLRVLLRLQNLGQQPAGPIVDMYSNLGSDADTATFLTSDGDTGVSEDDRWLITYGTGPSVEDAVVTQALWGKGARSAPNFSVLTQDTLGTRLNTVVPARGSRYLMFFASLDRKASDAADAARTFNRRLPKAYLAGMSAKVQRAVLNWELR